MPDSKTHHQNIVAKCNLCKGNRSCHVIYRHSDKVVEDYDNEYFSDNDVDYLILKCAGCGYVFFMTIEETADIDDDDEYIKYIDIYPKIATISPKQDITTHLLAIGKGNAYRLYREVCSSVNSACNCISVMGMRTLLDEVLKSQIGDFGNFKKNIDACVSEGILTKSQGDEVYSIIGFGNDVVHNSHVPSRDSVHIALNLVENVIRSLFVTPHMAGVLNSLRSSKKK